MSVYKFPHTTLHQTQLDTICEEIVDIRENMGTNDYTQMKNKPKINGVTLSGDVTGEDLGLADEEALDEKQDVLTAGNNVSIVGNVISATDTTYTAGENVSIVGNVISATDTKYTAGANIAIDEETGVISASGTIAGLSANRGLSLDSNNAVGHSNSLTGDTKGSATKVPQITYDNYGHITGVSEKTIYPPTTAGVSGQYWESDGNATGVWKDRGTVTAGSDSLVDGGTVYSAISGKIDTAGTGLTKSGTTLGHSNAIDANTAGSASSALTITFDGQGHLTEVGETPVYVPTTAGNAGEVWTSNGSGGAWSAPNAGSALLFYGAFSNNARETFNIAGKNALIASWTLPALDDVTSTTTANNWQTVIIPVSELTAKKYWGCYFNGAGPYRFSIEKDGNNIYVQREGSATITLKLIAL